MEDTIQIFYYSQEDLNRFNRHIGFKHLNKLTKLKLMLASYAEPHYKIGEFRKQIIDLLNAENNLTITQIAKKLNRIPSGSFRDRVRKLEKDGMIVSKINTERTKYYSLRS